MRWRSMVLAGAAVLAAVQVAGVLLGGPLWRFAEPATFVLTSGWLAAAGRPRWLGPVALSPLLVDALLTIPPATPATYGWQVLTTRPAHRDLLLEALDQGFRLAGPALLTVLVLLAVQRAATRAATAPQRVVPQPRNGRGARGWRRLVVALLGVGIVGYAAVRVGRIVGYLQEHPAADASGLAVAAAVLVPVSLALAALALAGQATGRAAPAGGVLIALAALPMTDSMIGSVPTPYPVDDPGVFGWAAITPTRTFPAPVAALTEALLLAGLLLVAANIGDRRRQAP